jgi:hypothetical protein
MVLHLQEMEPYHLKNKQAWYAIINYTDLSGSNKRKQLYNDQCQPHNFGG